MDSAENDPLATKSVFGSNWMRKRYRYEDDDIALSPPDDSSFFAVRYGPHYNKPVESMYDHINKELGLLEGPKGHVTSEPNVAPPNKATNGLPAEILLGPRGIFLENFKQPYASDLLFVSKDSSTDPPKIVIPPTLIEKSEEKVSSFAGLAGSPEKSWVAQQDLDTLVRKARGGRPTRKVSMNLADTIDHSLVERIQELEVEDPSTKKHLTSFFPAIPTSSTAPIIESVPTINPVPTIDLVPTIDPVPIVSGISDRRRKISAPPSLNPMTAEAQKTSNYFFTGSLFSSVASPAVSLLSLASKEASPAVSQHDLSSLPSSEVSTPPPSVVSGRCSPSVQTDVGGNFTLARTTSQMEERAKETAALEPKPRTRQRRPRASALREMNFMAPQSM